MTTEDRSPDDEALAPLIPRTFGLPGAVMLSWMIAGGVLYAMPALFLAFVLTGWIAMTVVAINLGEAVPLVGVSLAYLVGFVAVGMAMRFGWFGARRAWERFAARSGPKRSLRLTWVVEDDGSEEREP
jgi:hypothetical protein